MKKEESKGSLEMPENKRYKSSKRKKKQGKGDILTFQNRHQYFRNNCYQFI